MKFTVTFFFFITFALSVHSQTERPVGTYTLKPVDCPTLSPGTVYDLCSSPQATLVPVIQSTPNSTLSYAWSAQGGSNVTNGFNQMDLITGSAGIYTLTVSNVATFCSDQATYTVVTCVGIKENSFDALVSVLSNPFRDKLSITFTRSVAVFVFDSYGKFILTKNCDGGKNNIDLNGYPSGLYNIIIDSDGQYKSIKVVKE